MTIILNHLPLEAWVPSNAATCKVFKK